jgi:hypothetical protein
MSIVPIGRAKASCQSAMQRVAKSTQLFAALEMSGSLGTRSFST